MADVNKTLYKIVKFANWIVFCKFMKKLLFKLKYKGNVLKEINKIVVRPMKETN